MQTLRHVSLWSAVQSIVARTGLFAVTVVFVTLVYWQLDPVGDGWWIVPALLIAGLWLVTNGLQDRADHAAVSRLVAGAPPQNGRWTAVAGLAVARAEDDPGDILACHFQLYELQRERGNNRRSPRIRYDGYYLAPTGIDTGEAVVPMRGFPDMKHTPEDGLSGDLLARAQASGQRVPVYLLPPLARELAVAGVYDDLEKCIAYGEMPAGVDTRLDSWLLKRGEQVCVFGLWRDGTLRASYRRGRGLPLYEGTAVETAARLRGDAKGFLIFGTVLLTVALGVAVWSLM